jgi:uncharacterized membrane protein
MTFWRGVLWIHLLSMAFFVGGQLLVGAVLVPAFAGETDRSKFLQVARRFAYGTILAVLLLIITGSMLAGHLHVWSNGTLHIKMALVGVVIVLIGVHWFRPVWHWIDAALFIVSLAIVWCGTVIAF